MSRKQLILMLLGCCCLLTCRVDSPVTSRIADGPQDRATTRRCAARRDTVADTDEPNALLWLQSPQADAPLARAASTTVDNPQRRPGLRVDTALLRTSDWAETWLRHYSLVVRRSDGLLLREPAHPGGTIDTLRTAFRRVLPPINPALAHVRDDWRAASRPPDPLQRISSLWAVAVGADAPTAKVAVLTTLIWSEHPNTRVAARRALAKLRRWATHAVSILKATLLADAEMPVSAAADRMPALIQCLNHENDQIVLPTAQALGRTGPEADAAADALRILQNLPIAAMRDAASTALAGLTHYRERWLKLVHSARPAANSPSPPAVPEELASATEASAVP